MKKIVIAGGSGFLGTILAEYFSREGHEIFILSRKHQLDRDRVHYVKWDARSIGSWASALEGAEALINLTGKSVDCRYTEANKQLIYDSRINATDVLGEAIRSLQNPPRVWINASSATIYRHALDREMDEETGDIGEGFSVDVCKKWEAEFQSYEMPKTRKVILRIAIVLGKNGGVLEPLKNLAKLGLGGKQGDGDQYFSWLHEMDFCRIVDYTIKDDRLEGVYNSSAPEPIPNNQLMRKLRKVLRAPFGLNLPRWILEIGAILIKTETELILKSRRVVPKRLLESGFQFRYPTIEDALEELVS